MDGWMIGSIVDRKDGWVIVLMGEWVKRWMCD
jgi:hypothetical protein